MLENTAKLAKIEAQKAAYRERCRNFDALKEGLMNKCIAEELDLEDRQLESVLKLVETDEDNYSLSHGYFHACTAFGKTYLMMARKATAPKSRIKKSSSWKKTPKSWNR